MIAIVRNCWPLFEIEHQFAAENARTGARSCWLAYTIVVIIYFLRHASAGKIKLPGKKDEKRPLDKKGEKQCKEMGRLLFKLKVKPDAFISSPLTRAVQTAELVAEQIKFTADITLSDALRPDASYDEFQELLHQFQESKSIIIVGHNPNFSEFLSLLITKGADKKAIEMKKGAVAKLEPINGRYQLTWCVTPGLIRDAHRHS